MDSPSSKLIAIATYNELENLPDLVARLRKSVPSAEILIVDDNSPDGTPEWLLKNASSDFHSIIRKGKLGLGSATKEAFQFGLEKNYTLIATMDADFSHSPEDLPRLFERIEQPDFPDIVIGSRYIQGGAIEGWSRFRRIASWLINLETRWMLWLKSKDNSGAFRVYRTEALRKLPISAVRANGYGYLQETLYRMGRQGATVAEVPITFRDRERGQSKISFAESVKAAWNILTLRFRS